ATGRAGPEYDHGAFHQLGLRRSQHRFGFKSMSRESNNIVVKGVGWLDRQAFGCVRLRQRTVYGSLPEVLPPWKREDLLFHPVKNMGRFDAISRITCCACALTLRDAGLSLKNGQLSNIGLMGTNASGSLDANRAYFKDYLNAGRKMGRGNLFIYTLPSSPLAESAIHFGLQAPVMYIGIPGQGLSSLLDAAAALIADGSDGCMLAVRADDQEGLGFLLGTNEECGMEGPCSLDQVRHMIETPKKTGDLALHLESAMERSAGS
ncbi:MAG: hypothetical protein V2A34_06870, partial [Lentisphaerota bacterium]